MSAHRSRRDSLLSEVGSTRSTWAEDLTLALPALVYAALPVLTVASANTQYVNVGASLSGIAVAVVLAAAMWLVLRRVVVHTRRATLYEVLLIVWLFAFGHLVEILLPDIRLGSATTVTGPLLGAWTALFLLAGWKIHKMEAAKLRSTFRTVGVAGLGALFAVLIPFGGSTLSTLRHQQEAVFDNEWGLSRTAADPSHKASGRDIFFIVPDRYASDPVLARYFDYDNSWFTDSLRELGFRVTEKSTANYLRTAHSLASTLNMDYLRPWSTGEPDGSTSHSYTPVFRSIEHNRVVRILKGHGYSYYHLGSWWRGTGRSAEADYDYMAAEEPLCTGIPNVLIQTSVVGRALAVAHRTPCGTRERQRRRVNRKLEMLPAIAAKPELTFTFVHILSPHEPFVFRADGSRVSAADLQQMSWRQLYVEQVKYLNQEFLTVIKEIRERSTSEPVIVLQADEGPFSYVGELAVSFLDWCTAAPDSAYQKFGILSALSLPGVEDPGVAPDFSPVNSFRYILSEYFKYDLPLLPDKSFVFPVHGNIFDLHDVTGVLRRVAVAESASTELPDRLCPDVPEERLRQGKTGVGIPLLFRETQG